MYTYLKHVSCYTSMQSISSRGSIQILCWVLCQNWNLVIILCQSFLIVPVLSIAKTVKQGKREFNDKRLDYIERAFNYQWSNDTHLFDERSSRYKLVLSSDLYKNFMIISFIWSINPVSIISFAYNIHCTPPPPP